MSNTLDFTKILGIKFTGVEDEIIHYDATQTVDDKEVVFQMEYCIDGRLTILHDRSPVMRSVPKSLTDVSWALRRAVENLQTGKFEKVVLNGALNIDMVFEMGQCSINFSMDPVTMLFAMRVCEKAFADLLDSDEHQSKEVRFDAVQKNKVIQARAACRDEAAKLAQAVYDMNKTQPHEQS